MQLSFYVHRFARCAFGTILGATFMFSVACSFAAGTTKTALTATAPVISCKASPTSIALGDSATITTSATVATGVTVSYNWSTSEGTVFSNATTAGTTATLNTQGASVGTVVVTCAATTSQGTSASATTNVTVTAQVLAAAIPASYFGMSLQNFGTIHPSVTYATVRTWDAYSGSQTTTPGIDWPHISSASGVYNFAALDQFITYAQSRGTDIIYTFGRVPQWASTNPTLATCTYGPGECAPPNLTAWDAFVTAIVTHANGRIKYWELWNEPNDPYTYSGSIPMMVTLAQHASAIIRNLDPKAKILSPAATGPGGTTWTNTFLGDGGAATIDILAFHGYYNGTAESLPSLVSSYKSVLTARGVGTLPIWDTEAGWAAWDTGAPLTDPTAQQNFLAKYYLLHWANGVQRFVWYSFDGTTQWGQLWNLSAGLNSAGHGYEEINEWLVGASMNSPCGKSSSGIWWCGLARPGGYEAIVLWDSTGTAQWQAATKFVQMRTIAGGKSALTPGELITVGSTPVIIETGSEP